MAWESILKKPITIGRTRIGMKPLPEDDDECCEIARKEAEAKNPVDPNKKNLKTRGGEYLLPDGREYVGKYHTHADGTVMTDEAHKCGSSIILTPVYKRDDLE